MVVVWEEAVSGALLTNFRSGGSTWLFPPLSPVALPNSSQSLTQPIVKMQPNGTAQALYMVTGIPAANKLFYCEATTPGAWSTAEDLGVDNTMTEFDYDTNKKGDVVAVTKNATSAQTVTRVNGTWGTPSSVSAADAGTPSKLPSVGLSDSNQVVGAWLSGTPAEIQLGFAPLESTSWSILTMASGSALTSVGVSLSPNDNFVVGWVDNAQVFASVGQGTTLESSSAIVDALTAETTVDNMCIGNGGYAWVIYRIASQTVKASKTYFPTENLLKALGKKRLIYQQTRFP